MKGIIVEITHPKKKINFHLIVNRLKQFDFIDMIQCQQEYNRIEIDGQLNDVQPEIVKNALFQMGYTSQLINDRKK